jgi:Uma2 family endonuclease
MTAAEKMPERSPPRKAATYQDVLDAPNNMRAQLVEGELVLQPQPASGHQAASSVLGEELGPPFKRGKGGPGGWIILDEPEIHLGKNVLVPDMAGWKRSTMPEMPLVPYFTQTPDWVCEVLSPSTRQFDRGRKLQVYQEFGVSHVWFVDDEAQLLELLESRNGTYSFVQTAQAQDVVRAVPFDAIELQLGLLWMR